MSQYATPSAELRARVALEKHSFRNTHSLGQNFLLDEKLLGGAVVRMGDKLIDGSLKSRMKALEAQLLAD